MSTERDRLAEEWARIAEAKWPHLSGLALDLIRDAYIAGWSAMDADIRPLALAVGEAATHNAEALRLLLEQVRENERKPCEVVSGDLYDKEDRAYSLFYCFVHARDVMICEAKGLSE